MKSRALVISILIGVISGCAGCSGDPNEQANELYVAASQIMQKAMTDRTSYSNSLELYKESQNNIQRVLSDYPSSNVAVGLLSGQTTVADMQLREFEDIERSLTVLAEAEQNPLSCALLVSEEIEAVRNKVSLLIRIADQYIEAGQNEKAALVLSQALGVAETFEDEEQIVEYKVDVLTKVAGIYAETGEKEKAAQLLSQARDATTTLKDSSGKSAALRKIAEKYRAAGQFNQMLETTEMIENARHKVWALKEVAENYAKAGEKERAAQMLSQALEAVETLEEPGPRVGELTNIAESYAEIGEKRKAAQLLSQALEVAKTVEDPVIKAGILVEIADSYAAIGEKKKATQLLPQVLEVAKTVEYLIEKNGRPGRNAKTKLRLLGMSAKVLVSVGKMEEAAILLSQVNQEIDKGASEQIRRMEEMLVHRPDQSDRLVAAKAVITAEASETKVMWLTQFAGIYAKAGEKKKAAEALIQAIELAKTIITESEHKERERLANIARWYAEAGMYDQAIETAETIDNSASKVTALADIAGSYAEAGEKEKAAQLLSQALEVVKTAAHPYNKAVILLEIAEKYAEAGQHPNKNAITSLHEIVQKTEAGAAAQMFQ